jgi:hypothetical protein
MTKRKAFRRVKVGQMGYNAGQRQKMFLPPQKRSTRTECEKNNRVEEK